MIDVSRYSIQIKHVEIEGTFFYQAKVKEFPYLDEYADCAESAYRLALDAIETSILALQAEKKKVPEPCNEIEAENFSGRVTLRLPKTLHASLAQFAEYEGISLNQLLVSALSDFNGFNHTYYNQPIDHVVHKQHINVAPIKSRPLAVDEMADGGWSQAALA